MNLVPKALRVLPGRFQVLKSLKPEGFSLGSTRGLIGVSVTRTLLGLPVEGLAWAKANYYRTTSKKVQSHFLWPYWGKGCVSKVSTTLPLY